MPIPPFRITPRHGGPIAADDLARVFEMAYRASNLSGNNPIVVDHGPGGISISLSSELPDISYLNVTDKFVFAGDNMTTVHSCRLYSDTIYNDQPFQRTSPTRITRTASGPWTFIDGAVPVIGDRVLINIPNGDTANGIWEVSGVGAGGINATMDRPVDALISANYRAGLLVQIGPDGPMNGNTIWRLLNNNPVTLGTTNLRFAALSQSGWVQRVASFGTVYNTTSSTSMTIAGSGSFTCTVGSGLALVADMTLTIDAGSGNTMTGTVTSYSGTSLTFTSTASTGSGTFTSWTITTIEDQYGHWAGTLYDRDLVSVVPVRLTDANGNQPTVGVYYLAERATGIGGNQLWRTNVSGPVVLRVSCQPSGQPLATFGAAL